MDENEQKEDRISYARQRLIDMIEKRRLRAFCKSNNLDHTSFYKIAMGSQQPTYRTICSTCDIIPFIEWLYYTDEELPYEPVLLPKFDYTKKSKFIHEHCHEYKEIAKECGIMVQRSHAIFFSPNSYPSLSLMRKLCSRINPVDFFTDPDYNLPASFYVPKAGDIVYYGDGNSKHDKALILTSEEHCKTKHHYTYCIINNDVDGVRLTGTITSGFVSPYLIHTAEYKIYQLKFIENAGTELLDEVLNKVKKIFTMSSSNSVPLYYIHKP